VILDQNIVIFKIPNYYVSGEKQAVAGYFGLKKRAGSAY